jgi:voltage-gated potassium channel
MRYRAAAAEPASVTGSVRRPRRERGPVRQIMGRVASATVVLVVAWLVVVAGHGGYRDSVTGRPPSLVAAFYYVTVTLSATGYGDITPVTPVARWVSILVIAPLRVVFLIILIGTTVEVLVGRTREQLRRRRWRSRVTGHIVVVGYGVRGRAAIAALRGRGIDLAGLAIVDQREEEVAAANADGLTAVLGDGSSRTVLGTARVDTARAVVVTIPQDESALLATLNARALNPEALIVASVNDPDHVALFERNGGASVIAVADTVGRLLGDAALDRPPRDRTPRDRGSRTSAPPPGGRRGR